MAKQLDVVKFEPNPKGVVAMMKSSEMQKLLFGYADKWATQLTGEYGKFEARPVGEPVTGRVSAHAFVVTADFRAALSQAHHNVLNRI